MQQWIGVWVQWVHDRGYPVIVILRAMESSVFPIPSEVVIPPAGYWAAQGRYSFGGVVLAGTNGSYWAPRQPTGRRDGWGVPCWYGMGGICSALRPNCSAPNAGWPGTRRAACFSRDLCR